MDLVQLRREGERLRAEHEALRQHMKRHGYVERRFRILAQEVEERTDCRACANCCKRATVRLAERDVIRLAKALRLTPARFLAEYTTESPEEGLILKRDTNGCVFLSGNDCTVYEARPHNCQNFPHLVRGEGSLVSRMWDMADRATYCPIVFDSLAEFKREVKFRR